MTSNIYNINNFSITTSLNEMFIYFRVVNTLTYQCFEDNINITEINLPFNNQKKYLIISKCMNNNDNNYKVHLLINKNVLNLDFYVIFDTDFEIKFDIILKETIMKFDSKMTLNFYKIEDENNRKVRILENRIEYLEDIVERLVNMDYLMYISQPNPGSTNYFNGLKLNSLEFEIGNNSYSNNCLDKIQYFYKLNKLTVYGSYNHSSINFSSKSLKILVIQTDYFSSLQNLDKLPSLEEIEIRTASVSSSDKIIPYLHKNIKKITFFGGLGTSTKEKLIPYCLKNNIELIYA
jgi:hypothetical protein